jgi:hypothetical protein
MKNVTNLLVQIILVTAGLCSHASAQGNLAKNIPVLKVNKQPLADVLEILSNKGNFYFSYNSAIIKKDSLVTLTAYNKTVKEILDFLCKGRYEYKESGNYIIVRLAPLKLMLITNQVVSDDKFYSVSGYIEDIETGEKIADASVYEKQRLASSLTNEKGFFKIKLKAKYSRAALTVSKQFYEDTTVTINPKYNQQLTITIVPVVQQGRITIISPQDYFTPDSNVLPDKPGTSFTPYLYGNTNIIKVEKTKAGKFLFSARLKVQSLNLSQFFTTRPYQLSFIPPLSTNGWLNAQVINKVSLNAIGGYNAGVQGIEAGGVFNINKKYMHGVQYGGIFNLTGADVMGLQVAGNINVVLGSVKGVQVAGINNYAKKNIIGLQVAGIHNHADDTLTGVQIAGLTNFTHKQTNGLQIAGLINVTGHTTTGMQVSGIINYTKKLHGVQVGLVNFADSSDGYSIGLINIVRKGGYHKVSLYANDAMNTNVSLKTGNAKLYGIITGGTNVSNNAKVYSYGFGLGHDFILSKKITASAEISSQNIYLGKSDQKNILYKLSTNFSISFQKNISFFAGPSLNLYNSNAVATGAGYKQVIPVNTFRINNKIIAWLGWNAGVTLF